METSPFYNHDHPFLLDQYFCLPNPRTETAVAIGFSNEFHEPHDEVFPISSFEGNVHGNEASIGINNLKGSYSLMPKATTNSSSNDDKAKDNCKKGKKQKKSNEVDKENKKMKEEGYIHVRARRGEATDSHSLAERVRREKISEKMKTLQAIVPGCDQITGKALMLDQVINYVQTLQNEVQILSLELASVSNPMLHAYGTDFEEFMPRPHQDNGEEALWGPDNQREELIVDPFANINFNY